MLNRELHVVAQGVSQNDAGAIFVPLHCCVEQTGPQHAAPYSAQPGWPCSWPLLRPCPLPVTTVTHPCATQHTAKDRVPLRMCGWVHELAPRLEQHCGPGWPCETCSGTAASLLTVHRLPCFHTLRHISAKQLQQSLLQAEQVHSGAWSARKFALKQKHCSCAT